MRVGWGAFPEHIVKHVRKIMNPNTVSVAVQAAACAALKDHAYMRTTCQSTASARDRFITRLRTSGYDVAESFTNFVLIRFDSPEVAKQADMALQSEGVFLRPQSGAGLPERLRVTFGQAEDMNKTAALFERFAEETNR